MCFSLIKKSPDRKTITKRRMRVYKRFRLIVENGKTVAYSSPYQYHRYGLTEQVKIDIRKLRPKKLESRPRFLYPSSRIAKINFGLHSYSTKAQANKKRCHHEVVVECWLPIGTVYYINPDNHEIVSSHLNIGPMPDPKK